MCEWHFTFDGAVHASSARRWFDARREAARHFRCGEQDAVPCMPRGAVEGP